MGSHTLINLLSAANMTISGASLSEGVFTYPAGVFCMINQSLPVPIVGHKYYGRVDQKVPANTTFGDGRFEYFGGDGEGKNIVFTAFGNASQDNQWHTYSDILSFPYVAGENWTLRSFVVNGSQTVYRRKHMIIDLTKAFGAGNEPSKDWCDRCIPFFEGNITIESKPLVGVNGIARSIVGGYVGVSGVAKKIIAGYIGVNGVAKSILGIHGEKDELAYFIKGDFTMYENELVTSIGNYAFYKCDALITADFPNVTRIGDYAFNGCSSLTDVSFPNATSINLYAFCDCSSLTDVSFPNATSIGGYVFNRCSSLTDVSFPKATSIGSSAFYKCSSLTDVSFPKATSIGSYAFGDCNALRLLRAGLQSDTVCTLNSTNAIPSTIQTIYVPATLADAYKTDKNWSIFADKIVGV